VSLRKEAILSPCLGSRQPIQVLIECIFITRASAQHVTGRVCHRETHGREARALSEPPGDHWPQRQFSFSCRAPRLGAPQASGDVGERPHRTKRRPLLQRERVLDGAQMLQLSLVSQGKPDRFDLGLGTMTHMRKCAVEDRAVGALGLAQQRPRIRFATTGDARSVDIHSGYYYTIFMAPFKFQLTVSRKPPVVVGC